MNAAEPANIQHIVFGNENLTVGLSYAQDGPVTLTRLIFDGCRLELDALELPSGVPLVELQTPEAGHQTPVQGMAHTEWGQRLRYRNHELSSGDGWQRLTVDLGGDDVIDARLELAMPAGVAALTSQVTVTNRAAADLVLTSVPSLSMPVTGTLDGTVIDADGLDVWQGANDWLGENRWSSRSLRNSVVDLSAAGHGVEAKAGLVARSLGSWSTAAEVPSGVLGPRDGGFELAWQIEHNGAWCWEVSESLGSVRLTLSGPTDRHHQWVEVLASGESFRTVPVTVSVGRSWEDAVGWLTRYRRAARRPHPDNTRLTLIYNDYMNTLMGDPTTERLLPLIDAAADVGAEAFCIDAGWYDDGLNWWDSVGAWQPSPSRFPGGLAEVLERIRGRGMVAGLWLEPEVVGVRSEMADALPAEAFFSRHGLRLREAGRYHLDLRHPAARAHLDGVVDRLVGDFGVGYFKMDYNINPGPGTDRAAPSAGAGLLGHNRAVLDWLDGVLDRHPQLIIENCGSGAMRCDFAMLSRLQLQSTSDQQDVARYLPIALAAPMLMLPEQAGSWAYPSPTMNNEETAASLSLGLLGRLYLSGYLNQLSTAQLGLVREAVTAHQGLRGWIPTAVPQWPLGLPGWNDPWTALALSGPAQIDPARPDHAPAEPATTVLTVGKRAAEPGGVTIALPRLRGREVSVAPVFPRELPGWSFDWRAEPGLLSVDARVPGLSVRTVSLTG